MFCNQKRLQDLALPQFAVNRIYVTNLTTPLTTKTQNIEATSVINTITKSSQFKLSNSQVFYRDR